MLLQLAAIPHPARLAHVLLLGQTRRCNQGAVAHQFGILQPAMDCKGWTTGIMRM